MKWTRGPVIGHGSSATVSLATNAVSGDLFAVKHTDLSRSLPLQKERSLLCRLQPSPHIVKYLGSTITNESNNLVFNLCIEYISGGTLHDSIRSTVRGFFDNEVEIQSYTRGILRGLEHLHENGVAHCDVKSQNVLVGRDGVKIADLGCAKLIGDKSDSSSFSGTPMFMAPEVVRGEKQGLEADVWALGCTVIEMATGTVPWPESTDSSSVLYRIGFSKDVPETPRWLSEEARDFLEKCLRRDPGERWTVQELLFHPFIRESESREGGKDLVFSPESSPNGVLDRVFWESSDFRSISSSHADDEFIGDCLDCASDRLKNLLMGELDSRSPDWTDHGDWVAVRSNEEEEDEVERVVMTAAISEEAAYVILFSGGGVDSDGISPAMEDDSHSVLLLKQLMSTILNINLDLTICDLQPESGLERSTTSWSNDLIFIFTKYLQESIKQQINYKMLGLIYSIINFINVTN